MGLSLSKSQMFFLMLLVLVTFVILGLITFATVAHIDVWHMVTSSIATPKGMFPHN